jgi:hypothetical protein
MRPSNAAAVLALVAAAHSTGGTVVETPVGTIIVLPRQATASPDELLPLTEAARIAATSKRVVKDAIRAGVLPAVGGQRDRAVRRRDLEAWIEGRRAPVARVADGQQSRVERRLARSQKAGGR